MTSDAQKRSNIKWNKNHPEVMKTARKKYVDTHRQKVYGYFSKWRANKRILNKAFLELTNIPIDLFD